MDGRTRRRLSVALAGALFAAIAAHTTHSEALGAARDGAAAQAGVFALLDGTPKVASEAWTTTNSHTTQVTLTIRQLQLPAKEPVVKYDIEMQKLIHLIVVRDDFATFAHLHPAFDAKSGTFQQSLTAENDHGYYLYADTTPQGIGQQVFRFTLQPGGRLGTDTPSSDTPYDAALARAVNVPPYTVELARTTLSANERQRIDLTILERGRPAAGLAPYLGAAAHAVFINTRTLAYVHVHPDLRGSTSSTAAAPSMDAGMKMSVARAGPLLQLDVPALPRGVYKLWIEFRGAKDAVYTAPFTMLVR